MNYEEAMNLTGADIFGMFWWVGLIFIAVIVGRYARWIRPK